MDRDPDLLGIAIAVILPGQEVFLGNLYAFGALLSFTFAHASVARLRAKKKDVPRPYRGPGNVNIRGYDAPLFAIVGGTFTCIAFVVIAVLYPTVTCSASAGWCSGSRLHRVPPPQGLDLASTHKVAIAQPVVDHEAEYDSVLVHFGDSGYDDQVLGTARKLAARKRRGIHVLVTITVPNSMEIDAPMPDQEASAQPSSRRRRWPAAAASPATSSASAPARPGAGSSRTRSTCARRRS